MSKLKFTGARPVRFQPGLGWQPCETHRAQRWQAVLADRVLGSAPYYQSKAKAMEALTANVARHAPLPRSYQLGKRMPR